MIGWASNLTNCSFRFYFHSISTYKVAEVFGLKKKSSTLTFSTSWTTLKMSVCPELMNERAILRNYQADVNDFSKVIVEVSMLVLFKTLQLISFRSDLLRRYSASASRVISTFSLKWKYLLNKIYLIDFNKIWYTPYTNE